MMLLSLRPTFSKVLNHASISSTRKLFQSQWVEYEGIEVSSFWLERSRGTRLGRLLTRTALPRKHGRGCRRVLAEFRTRKTRSMPHSR